MLLKHVHVGRGLVVEEQISKVEIYDLSKKEKVHQGNYVLLTHVHVGLVWVVEERISKVEKRESLPRKLCDFNACACRSSLSSL